jgi:hypothetical protein
MTRILCLVISCILALVLLSASDVSAINISKIIGNEYHVKGLATSYSDGSYTGTAVAEGMMVIKEPEDGVLAVTTVITDLSSTLMYGVYQYYCTFQFGPYEQKGNRLTSDTCAIDCIGPDYSTPILNYDGDCDFTINLQGEKKLKSTVEFTTDEGVEMVFTGQGEKLGQWTTPLPTLP